MNRLLRVAVYALLGYVGFVAAVNTVLELADR